MWRQSDNILATMRQKTEHAGTSDHMTGGHVTQNVYLWLPWRQYDPCPFIRLRGWQLKGHTKDADLGLFSNFYIMKNDIFSPSIRWFWLVVNFNRPSPEVDYFYSESGLEATFLITLQNRKPQLRRFAKEHFSARLRIFSTQLGFKISVIFCYDPSVRHSDMKF